MINILCLYVSRTLWVFNTVPFPFLLKSLCNVVIPQGPALSLLDCLSISASVPPSATASQHSEERAILYPFFDPPLVSSKTRRQLNTTILGEGGGDPRKMGGEEKDELKLKATLGLSPMSEETSKKSNNKNQ